MDAEEKGKLRALLAYWVEHNNEHGEEFQEWAAKARAMDEPEVGGELLQAVEAMNRASQVLAQALKRLEG